MADSLLSPAVGGGMWLVSMGALAVAARRARTRMDDATPARMGVLGAFVFAAQMINYAIPGTGSSGHLCGGLLLAILLGPDAAFLTVASVIMVQSLFFYDGGLMALGCNIMNMGFWGCYVGYGLVYRPLTARRATRGRVLAASIAGSVVALQLGAGSVVLETVASGVSALPLTRFLLLMLPIHVAIGVGEGFVTAAVVSFLREARPEVFQRAAPPAAAGRRILAPLLVATVLVAGVLSWYASRKPDGLEWALQKQTGRTELEGGGSRVAGAVRQLQSATAFMPDYAFKSSAATPEPSQAAARAGTSTAGLVGAMLTLAAVALLGWALRRRSGVPPQRDAARR